MYLDVFFGSWWGVGTVRFGREWIDSADNTDTWVMLHILMYMRIFKPEHVVRIKPATKRLCERFDVRLRTTGQMIPSNGSP